MKLPQVTTALQIRFADIDMLGHVSNAVYPQFFDLGRIDFFRAIETDEPLPNSVVRHVEYDIRREIKMFDTASIDTWCSHIGNTSMKIQHRVMVNGECAVECQLVLVAFDENKRSVVPWPRDWQASE